MKRRLSAFALCCALAAACQAQDTATFTDKDLGLSFDHPAAWKVKKEKYETVLLIPLEGRREPATLQIFSEPYGAEAERWEEAQTQMNKQLRREVVRQWREEILGVPMLLTRIAYDEQGAPVTALMGMLYSRTQKKMIFRLTAPTDDYDAVELQFRDALQTLRTTTGDLPQAEDPNAAFDPTNLDRADRPASGSTKITRITEKPVAAPKITKGEVALPLVVANRNVELRLPAGWSGEPTEDGDLLLKREGVSGPVRVSVNALIDSDRPESALLKTSAARLEAFKLVELRTETQPKTSAAGATVKTVWRKGPGSEGGVLSTCEAYGELEGFYWLLTYRIDGEVSKGERQLLEALVNGMSVEPAP